MATIVFGLSSKKDEFSRSEIMLRFTAGRALQFRVKTGLLVSAKRWSKKNEISIPKIENDERRELIELSESLNGLKWYILKEFESSDKSTINKAWLVKCIDKYHFPDKYIEKVSGPDFYSLFNEFLAKKKYSDFRRRSFESIIRSLKRYDIWAKRVKKRQIDIMTINEDVLIDIEDFLKKEHLIKFEHPDIYKRVPESREPAERGRNTISGIFVKLRTFIKWANDTGKIANNPFVNYSIESCVYGTPVYITKEEKNLLYSSIMSRGALAIQRDIFVFQCNIGCRVGDLLKMKKSNIINGAIEYIARKTMEGRPVTVRVPLNAQAKEIVERYKHTEGEKLLPFITEQQYNRCIHEAFLEAGLTRMVTFLNPTTRKEEKRPLNEIASSHMARRTFIGNLYKQVKDPNLISQLSGHKDGSRAFSRYRDIDDEIKTELVEMLL
jgi:integrase